MNVEEVTIIVAMVMSVMPVMWIAYLYYRLEINKLKLAVKIEQTRYETEPSVSETKPALFPKKE